MPCSTLCLHISPTVIEQAFNKIAIYLIALVMLMVSHQTSYCISSGVTKHLNKSLDHDFVDYSNTVENMFAQQDQPHAVKSFKIVTTPL